MSHRRTNIQTFKNSSRLRKNQTEAESRLWQVLCAHRLNDFHFRRQHARKCCVPVHGITGTGIDRSQLYTGQAKIRARELGVADQVKKPDP